MNRHGPLTTLLALACLVATHSGLGCENDPTLVRDYWFTTYGTVQHAETNNPLEGAFVGIGRVYSDTLSFVFTAITDSSGVYGFENLGVRPTKEVLEFSKDGFQILRVTVADVAEQENSYQYRYDAALVPR